MHDYSRAITISTTSKAGVHTSTERGSSFLAVTTPTIGDVERHHHAITLFQKRDTLTQLLNDSHVLVTYLPFSNKFRDRSEPS
jgi:hypothetical protein